ncbi:MAG: zinc/iron-chelating domain-containing protein [Desulfuromonas sp.]|nr:MAG: zinc/iron-chelating domain-containing protein [Desulfuromonas sp.]
MNEVTEFQHLFDLQVDEWLTGYRKRGGQVYCKRGCSNCCSLVVNCSFPEAVWVARHLPDCYDKVLGDYVERLVALATESKDLKGYLRNVRYYAGGCPFLEQDGACGIYSWRPLSCRALLSTAPAKFCAADFPNMPQSEKQAFLHSLDREAVRYPTAYVEITQHLAQQLEQLLLGSMQNEFGVSLSGNLPYLVWLERQHNISLQLTRGQGELLRSLALLNLEKRYLTELCRGKQRVHVTPHRES